MRVRRARRGMTLIEVLATISVLLVVATTAASILGAITEVGTRFNKGRETRASVIRLAKQFRADVTVASGVAQQKEGWPLELTQGKDVVKYDWELNEAAIARSVYRDDQRTAIDHFRVSSRFQPRVDMSEDRVTLILREVETTMPWVIEVARK